MQTNSVNGSGYKNIYNYGFISDYIYLAQAESEATNITNYGEMGGVVQNVNASKAFTIDNRGTINLFQQDNQGKKIHFRNIKSLTLKNYAMRISESASVFNNFNGNATDNSHLILDNVTSVSFADSAKIFLDFGGDFSINSPYSLDKLIVDTNGDKKLAVEFDRLVSNDDFYKLIQQGNYFIAQAFPQHSVISNISKANVRTMNNFYTISNAMIYPRKSYHSQNLRSSSLRASARERGNPFALSSLRADSQNLHSNPPYEKSLDSALDSANPLKSYESFSYRSEAQNRRIQRQNKRNYNRKTNNAESSVKSQGGLPRATSRARNDNFNNSVNESQNPHDYYFILTPFINYNSFAKSGNYNFSGFDYGFLTAFSATIVESNHLGTHFIMSYGSLGDKQDKDLSIKSLNLNLGLNYKLDLIFDMFLKARGDFYYFSNAIDSLTIKNIKPNNLGFGVSVSYGKDFDFKEGGVLGLEVGLDYKALQTNEVSLNSQHYKQSLLNLIYADVGLNYSKLFVGGFGINLGTGFKANLAPKLAKSALLVNTQNLQFTIDNDKYLAYANLGASYVLNTKNFDMEFSLAYYGNYGDRGMSNGGGFEWRVEF